MCNVWGLERSQFTTHLITRLTQGLEMTLSIFIPDQISILDVYQGLERSQLLSTLLSTASCTVSWGLEMTLVDVLFTAGSYPIDLEGLEFCG